MITFKYYSLKINSIQKIAFPTVSIQIRPRKDSHIHPLHEKSTENEYRLSNGHTETYMYFCSALQMTIYQVRFYWLLKFSEKKNILT